MSNRTRVEGFIYYREKEGRYMAQAYFPTPDGRKVRKCFYGKTREEVLEKIWHRLISQPQMVERSVNVFTGRQERKHLKK